MHEQSRFQWVKEHIPEIITLALAYVAVSGAIEYAQYDGQYGCKINPSPSSWAGCPLIDAGNAATDFVFGHSSDQLQDVPLELPQE